MTKENRTPQQKMPEHLSTVRPGKTREDKIDAQMADTFPASDPPSYAGGNHIIGAPVGRESGAADHDDVAEAESKARAGAGSKK